MAQGNSSGKTRGVKLLLLAIYVVLLAGLVLLTSFLLSAFSGSKPTFSITNWFSDSPSPPPPSPAVDRITNSSPPSKRVNPSLLRNTKNSSEPTPNTTVYVPPLAASGASVSAPWPQKILTKAIWDVPLDARMPDLPDLKTFQLTKEMVKPRVKENIIIVNIWELCIHGLHCQLGAMDTKLLEALYWKGIPVFDMGSKMNTIDVGWGSPSFHKMGREKVFLVNAFLSFGHELLMCDADMVWLKNPLLYLACFSAADLLTSSDQVNPTVTDDSLKSGRKLTQTTTLEFFHWRPTDPARRLAKAWKDQLLRDDNLWDQYGFNVLVKKHLGPSVQGEDGLVYVFDGNLKLGILPSSIFCSGHTYFVQAMHQQLRLEPYAVHTTFQYSGTKGKHHRLREAMLFYDPREYYGSPGGFLSFKPRIPRSLLLDGAHTIESHFTLVNYQYKHIWAALAIASLLNRTLIFPPTWCRLEPVASTPPGIMEGAITRLPFLCPLDNIIKVNTMLSELPQGDFGPKIDFREYSFLQNPLLPKKVKEFMLKVQLCNKKSPKCTVPDKPTQRGILRLPKNSSQEMFVKVFSKYKDVKALQFSSMDDAFGGFSNKIMEAKFRNRVKRYAGIWCCMIGRSPAHIYYDMYWYEKPGWKPEPPESEAKDHPPW